MKTFQDLRSWRPCAPAVQWASMMPWTTVEAALAAAKEHNT